jgi:hypothetical protein
MPGLVDARGVGAPVGEVVHPRGELPAGVDDLLGVGVEQVAETTLLGQKAAEHAGSGRG